MYICKNCGQTYQSPVNFCGSCGGQVTEAQEAVQPEYTAPVNSAPYTYANPTPAPTGSKGPAIVGLIFGILAMIFSFISIGIASMALDEADSYYYYYHGLDSLREEAFAILGVFSIFVLPFIIVGLVTSLRKSSLKGVAITGRITSFIGLGMWILSFLMVASI